MGLLSVPVDRTPAWAKIDLQLHQSYRTWLGFGRLRCFWCGARWGRHGCPDRESAAKLFVYTASRAQLDAALEAGDLSEADLELTRRRPSRHRRRPSPHPAQRRNPHPGFVQTAAELGLIDPLPARADLARAR